MARENIDLLKIPILNGLDIITEKTGEKIHKTLSIIDKNYDIKGNYSTKDSKIASFYLGLSNGFIFPMIELLEKKYNSFSEFYNDLVNMFKDNIFKFYENELHLNNGLHNLSKDKIKKHIDILENNLLINDEFLKDINNLTVGEFDFRDISKKEEEKEEEKEDSLIVEIKSGYEISQEKIEELFNNFLNNIIKDLNSIFIKFDKKEQSNLDFNGNKELNQNGLKINKDYHLNIYSYIYAVNKILELNLIEINKVIILASKTTTPELTNDEINLISYNSMKRYFNI